METVAMNTEFWCRILLEDRNGEGKRERISIYYTGCGDQRWIEVAHIHAQWNTLIKRRYYLL
jgi:hypothetical protein